MRKCKNCGSKVNNRVAIYCSNRCQLDFQFLQYIDDWKKGKNDGSRGENTKSISKHIRRYLFEKYKSSGSECNWNQVNPNTGTTPLEIDHIDGTSENNFESNLRLLCPNCHSLTSSFRNLNRGNGREWRRLKYIKNVRRLSSAG